LSRSFASVALRPKWIGALFLALAIAAGFALLGQWQLSRAVDGGIVTEEQTETVVPLDSIATPQQPMPAETIGQLVSLDAEFVPGDYVVLSDRFSGFEPGYWVVGHGLRSDGSSIAVALGWTGTADAAASAIRTLEASPLPPTMEGRYLSSESPQQSDFEAGQRSALAVAELVNLWAEAPDGVYGGYVVLDDEVAGLTRIDSPPPNTEVSLNLLNIFYAVEWVLFAGFAIFLWYRVVRDAWELEL
jgi:cytochrome oxidase assembly protein ShyY1